MKNKASTFIHQLEECLRWEALPQEMLNTFPFYNIQKTILHRRTVGYIVSVRTPAPSSTVFISAKENLNETIMDIVQQVLSHAKRL